MTKLATINAAAMAVIRKMLPLLAGNLPRIIQYYSSCCQCVPTGVVLLTYLTWLSKYLLPPTNSTMMAMPMNVAPSGLPTCRRWYEFPGSLGSRPSLREIVVLSRNSWVIAIPIEANAKDVRSHARNVRSARQVSFRGGRCHRIYLEAYQAPDGLVRHCPCCPVPRCRTYPLGLSTIPRCP